MDPIFFDSGAALWRVALSSVLGYAGLVAMLRISGRRTLSKMNAFDLIVTVALGSILASIVLSRGVTLAQGGLALALLIGMQYLVTWSSVRLPWVRRLVTGEPALLLHRGEMLPGALHVARVTPAEIRAAVRSAGLASLDEVEAVVLETDGELSVVSRRDGGESSSLSDVERPG